MNTSNDERKQQERRRLSWVDTEHIPLTKHISTKSSWQIVRDITANILARKSAKFSLKQGMFISLAFLLYKHI